MNSAKPTAPQVHHNLAKPIITHNLPQAIIVIKGIATGRLTCYPQKREMFFMLWLYCFCANTAARIDRPGDSQIAWSKRQGVHFGNSFDQPAQLPARLFGDMRRNKIRPSSKERIRYGEMFIMLWLYRFYIRFWGRCFRWTRSSSHDKSISRYHHILILFPQWFLFRIS